MTKLRPSVILGVTGVIVLLILLSLAQEMNRRWQVQQEVQELEQEATKLHNNIVKLEHLNQYFRTDDYQERLAREKLNYRAPGEKVVLIPEKDIEQPDVASQESSPTRNEPTPMRWWRVFFVDERPGTS